MRSLVPRVRFLLAAASAGLVLLLAAPAGALFLPPLDFVPIQAEAYDGPLGPVAVVASGGTVTWENHEFLPGVTDHTVTADDGSFASGIIPQHSTFAAVIRAPSGATITYHCDLYP